MAGPLAGTRVLDLSRVLAGPWAGQNLADLGAEVIKIERPKVGDDSRAFGPPWIKDREGRDTRDSAYFTSANRGKKSVTVNLQAAEGAALVRALAAKSDVLIENYKYGDLERYGLAYAQLKDSNPRLVYCSVTGFGHTGPYRERPGYDFMIQGMGGMMSVTGEPGGEPQRAGVPIADIITGMYASIAICAALAHRAQSGKGQHLDLALLDSQIALLAYQNTNYFATGKPPKRIGNLHPNIVPYQPFRCADVAATAASACANTAAPRRAGLRPAREPNAARPCTDAAASPASTGASAAHASRSSPACNSPCARSRRSTSGSTVASTSSTSIAVSRRRGWKRRCPGSPAKTPSRTRAWKCTFRFNASPNRWTNVTAPQRIRPRQPSRSRARRRIDTNTARTSTRRTALVSAASNAMR